MRVAIPLSRRPLDVALVVFFLVNLCFSVPWMDRRMTSRHPAWGARLEAVPALLPWPGRRR